MPSKSMLAGPYRTRDPRRPWAITVKRDSGNVVTLRYREQDVAQRATNRLRRHGMTLDAVAAEISKGA